MGGVEVARRLGVSKPVVTQAARRGSKIIEKSHLKPKEDCNLMFLWTASLGMILDNEDS